MNTDLGFETPILAGDTLVLVVTLQDAAGVSLDASTLGITSAACGVVECKTGLEMLVVTLGAGIEVTGATVTVTIDGAASADLAGRYLWELELVSSYGHTTPTYGAIMYQGSAVYG